MDAKETVVPAEGGQLISIERADLSKSGIESQRSVTF